MRRAANQGLQKVSRKTLSTTELQKKRNGSSLRREEPFLSQSAGYFVRSIFFVSENTLPDSDEIAVTRKR